MKKFLFPFLLVLVLVGCTVNVQLPPTVTATAVPTQTVTATPQPTATAAPTPTATPSNIVDRWFFVRSQLMRIHFQLNLDTGDYDVRGIPADEPEENDEVLTTQYELTLIYESYGYDDPGAIDWVLGWYERTHLEEVQALSRLTRNPWHRTGNLYKQDN